MGKLWFRNVGWRNELYAVSKDYVPYCILTALRSVEDQVLFCLRSSAPFFFSKEKELQNDTSKHVLKYCKTDAVFTA